MTSGPFNMTALGEALKRRLEAIFESFRLSAQNPDNVPWSKCDRVTVYLGSVGPRTRDQDSGEVGPQFPLVIVKPRACDDEAPEGGAQRTIVHVDFVIGVRRLNEEGYLDIAAVVERIRTNLLREPIIENGARMELPLKSEIGEDDAFPQWVGLMSAQFSIPQPVEECDI